MSSPEPLDEFEFINELRQAMQYPDHGAAQRLRRMLQHQGPAPRYSGAASPHLGWLHRSRWPRTQGGRLVLAAVLLLTVSGVALAATTVTNLGKPTEIQSTAAYFPLSGFHRVSTSFEVHGKPELVFIGAQGPRYEHVNVERWPLIKALQQFGTLSGVKAVERTCTTFNTHFIRNAVGCSIPTFDLSKAYYTSRYIEFSSKDLVQSSGLTPGDIKVQLFQRLNSTEAMLFNRYARFKGQPYCSTTKTSVQMHPCSKPIDYITATLFPDSSHPSRTLPLIAIGHYVQTVSQDVGPSDLAVTVGNTPTPGTIVYAGVSQGMPFNTVRQALANGKDPQGSLLVEHVNAEANIITALICRVDGKRPASVCTRASIQQILKHVK